MDNDWQFGQILSIIQSARMQRFFESLAIDLATEPRQLPFLKLFLKYSTETDRRIIAMQNMYL